MKISEVKIPRGDGHFRVVIVGGSIAGLTLAHCLHRAGIDYVILERRQEIAPQEGASIGIMPNGARILEQLGLYETLEADVHPLETAQITYPDGFSYRSNFPQLLRERFGYPLAFLDRQTVLRHLGASLPDPDRLHIGKAVSRLEQHQNHVRVHAKDGTYFDGNLVVGADGVHSKVRTEMWRLAEELGMGLGNHGLSKELFGSTTVDYGCVFGISSPHENLAAGQQISCYNNGWSILSVVGKNGRIYWFLFFRLDQQYTYSNAPRLSSGEGAKRCEGLVHEPFWQHIRFGEVWERRETFNTTVLEEFVLSKWHWDKIVCLGDSAHKIAPHTGQGANCAMEDAAALCNVLQPFANSGPLSSTHLDRLLLTFVADRRSRMARIAHGSRLAMRVQAREGLAKRLLGRYIFPYAGDTPANKASEAIANAAILSFLPVPQRSGTGWAQFGSKGKMEKALSLPVIMLGLASMVLFKVW